MHVVGVAFAICLSLAESSVSAPRSNWTRATSTSSEPSSNVTLSTLTTISESIVTHTSWSSQSPSFLVLTETSWIPGHPVKYTSTESEQPTYYPIETVRTLSGSSYEAVPTSGSGGNEEGSGSGFTEPSQSGSSTGAGQGSGQYSSIGTNQSEEGSGSSGSGQSGGSGGQTEGEGGTGGSSGQTEGESSSGGSGGSGQTGSSSGSTGSGGSSGSSGSGEGVSSGLTGSGQGEEGLGSTGQSEQTAAETGVQGQVGGNGGGLATGTIWQEGTPAASVVTGTGWASASPVEKLLTLTIYSSDGPLYPLQEFSTLSLPATTTLTFGSDLHPTSTSTASTSSPTTFSSANTTANATSHASSTTSTAPAYSSCVPFPYVGPDMNVTEFRIEQGQWTIDQEQVSHFFIEYWADCEPLYRTGQLMDYLGLNLPGQGKKFLGDGFIDGEAAWFTEVPNRTRSDPVVLYIHGGGYYWGLLPSQVDAVNQINEGVNNSRLSWLMLDYTLTNVAGFPQQLAEAVRTYNELLKSSDNIIIFADSSGAHLALVLLWHMQKPLYTIESIPRNNATRAIALSSPWTSFNGYSSILWVYNAGIDIFSQSWRFPVYDLPTTAADWSNIWPARVFLTYGSEDSVVTQTEDLMKNSGLREDEVYVEPNGQHDELVVKGNETMVREFVNFFASIT